MAHEVKVYLEGLSLPRPGTHLPLVLAFEADGTVKRCAGADSWPVGTAIEIQAVDRAPLTNAAVDPGAEAATIDGWRSFPENMPPENVTVWIWTDVHDWPAKGYYSHGSWYYTMTGCMVYDGIVTHWMPIQPPPTKPKGVEE